MFAYRVGFQELRKVIGRTTTRTNRRSGNNGRRTRSSGQKREFTDDRTSMNGREEFVGPIHVRIPFHDDQEEVTLIALAEKHITRTEINSGKSIDVGDFEQ